MPFLGCSEWLSRCYGIATMFEWLSTDCYVVALSLKCPSEAFFQWLWYRIS